jgi:DNA-binding NtrC family response regulator
MIDEPDTLPHLVEVIAQRLYGDAGGEVAEEVVGWINHHLGAGYSWPGNIRELEQCIRNVVVRKEYHPLTAKSRGAVEAFWARAHKLQLSADELLRSYSTLVYRQTGSYLETARRLHLDRRTVKGNIDRQLLEQLVARKVVED